MKAFEDWQPQAACIGKPTAWWFPDSTGQWGIYDAARQICRHCPVANDCLNYAIAGGLTHGMYGGLTPDERHDRGKCATEAGWKAHATAETTPCDECRDARRAAHARRERARRLAEATR